MMTGASPSHLLLADLRPAELRLLALLILWPLALGAILIALIRSTWWRRLRARGSWDSSADAPELNRLLLRLEQAVLAENDRRLRVMVVGAAFGVACLCVVVSPGIIRLIRSGDGDKADEGELLSHRMLALIVTTICSLIKCSTAMGLIIALRPTDRKALRSGVMLLSLIVLMVALEGLIELRDVLIPLAEDGADLPSRLLRMIPCASAIFIILSQIVLVVGLVRIAATSAPRSCVDEAWNYVRRTVFCILPAHIIRSITYNLILALDGEAASAYESLYQNHIGKLLEAVGVYIAFSMLTPALRGRVRRAISEWGLPENARGLAMMAMLMSEGPLGTDFRSVARDAARRFRGIPFSALRPEHMSKAHATEEERAELAKFVVFPPLNGVDAFVCHSWSDDGFAKYSALASWAETFRMTHKREPIVWFDKACVDGQRAGNMGGINAELSYLAIYVSACTTLIVVAGKTCTSRLWCIVEIFCFLTMGSSMSDIIVLDAGHFATDAETGSALKVPASPAVLSHRGRISVRSLWKSAGREQAGAGNRKGRMSFRLEEAGCEVQGERDRILAAIEATYGDTSVFDYEMEKLFSEAHGKRRWSQEPVLRRGETRELYYD